MAKSLDVERGASVLEHVRAARMYAAMHRREFIPSWYQWQLRFFNKGLRHRVRMLLCGNRGGKTLISTYEDALHLTGDYPDWWKGARIDYPINAWLFGVDAQQTRDVLQKDLLGDTTDNGETYLGGWVHSDEIVYESIERAQLKGAINQVRIRHASGGFSTVSFRSYRQIMTGQSTLPAAGSSVDLIHGDEQPPDPLVGQLVTRAMTGRRGDGGLVIWTMTPELGLTDLVHQFYKGKLQPHQTLVGPVGWAECPHLTPEIQKQLLADLPEHEHDMRSKGIPLFGTGRIYRPDEKRMVIKPFNLAEKPGLRVIKAMDIGIAHPTAIVWLAYDPESKTYYLVKTYRESNKEAAVHGAVANSMWPHAPTVYPPDADTREKGSGEALLPKYQLKKSQLFSNPDDSKTVEPGILEIQEAMSQDRFKVFEGDCEEFLEEVRTYHRDERGNIVKERDDVVDAVRYAVQTIGRFGVLVESRNSEYTGGLYRDLGLRSGRNQRRSGVHGRRI